MCQRILQLKPGVRQVRSGVRRKAKGNRTTKIKNASHRVHRGSEFAEFLREKF
jgi:hypothetical protein